MNPVGWQRWIFQQIMAPPRAQILELGAGTGELWLDNIAAVPREWSVTISDLSGGMAREAQDRIAEAGLVVHAVVADARCIPFDDASFDVVVANMMLYHVPERKAAVGEIRRVL